MMQLNLAVNTGST